jgi:ABC-type branched-subunit amino acid transport system substrate-binding protein
MVVALSACAVPRPTIKIALVAPFEGRFREVGYDAFPAMRLALRQQIEAGGVGNYEVEFVAYNDNADPAFAERVAHNVVYDASVVAVIGNLRADTTRAAQPVYSAAGLALVALAVPADQVPGGPLVFRLGPSIGVQKSKLAASGCTNAAADIQTTNEQAYRGSAISGTLALLPSFQSPAAPNLLGSSIAGLCFTASSPYPRDFPAAAQPLGAFSQVSGGPPPGPGSISAYDATRLILAAIRADIAAHGSPTRPGVAEALRLISFGGLLGQVTFNADNSWASAPVWVYQYDARGTAHLIK